MDEKIRAAITTAVQREPLAQTLGMRLVDLGEGMSVVEMDCRPQKTGNLFARPHGGAIYALIDEAFETAAQTDGTVCVALNVNVSYISSPDPGGRLRAEAKRSSRTRKTAGFDIRVTAADGSLVATCQALAYRTGKPLPFLDEQIAIPECVDEGKIPPPAG